MGSVGEDRTSDRPSDRITTAEAAHRLGITEGAVRKRAQRAKIRHERDDDGRLWVWLSPDETRRDSPRYGPGQSRDSSQLVDELRERVAFLEAELKIRTEENRRKDHLLAAALERIPALEPPGEPESASETVPGTETPPEPAEQKPHKEESSPPQGQDSSDRTLREGAQRGILVAPHPRWLQIGVAVLLAGSITTIPQAILELATGTFPGPLFVFGVLHALTLLCGLWAGLAWPGRHLKGLVALGSLAGLLDLTINWSIFHLFSLGLIPILRYWSSINTLDFLSDIGIAALFTAGGLFGDLIESRRIPRKRGEESEVVREIAEKASGPRRQPSETTLKLVQALGPSLLALIGVILGLIPILLNKQ